MFRLKMWPALRVGLLTVVACLALTALCGWAGSCGTALHKAAVSADSIAASLHTAADLNHSLWASGQITLEERQQMATLIDQASQANDELVTDLQSASAKGTPVTAASVTAKFNTFLTRLDGLEKYGVLHLKSAQAQAQFETILGAVKTEVTILQGILGSTSGQNRIPGPIPVGTGLLMCAALVLTPEEIVALIGLTTEAVGEGAALVQKLMAMKGEADEALLADALTEDAAARKQAQADEGAV